MARQDLKEKKWNFVVICFVIYFCQSCLLPHPVYFLLSFESSFSDPCMTAAQLEKVESCFDSKSGFSDRAEFKKFFLNLILSFSFSYHFQRCNLYPKFFSVLKRNLEEENGKKKWRSKNFLPFFISASHFRKCFNYIIFVTLTKNFLCNFPELSKTNF